MRWLLVPALMCIAAAAAPSQIVAPKILESRTVTLTQTVTLKDIPAGAGRVQMWVPVPSDAAWQRVVDRKVVSAPGSWKLIRQGEGRGDFVYVDMKKPADKEAAVVFSCTVQRWGVEFPPDKMPKAAVADLQTQLFEDDLNTHASLMEVDLKVKALADKSCGDETDIAKQAVLLVKAVADNADHYSKDPSKPKCGRGAASDCLEHGGGCCTDLHSLFIAMARSRGIPARMQYGYRVLDNKAGSAYDPGYRCWVEFFVPGAGWIPTDIVAADNADAANPHRWASLSATRVWLWQGRDFQLTPQAASGPIPTMTCGWAEIDGKAVDVLPAADGSPSKLTRTVKFEIVSDERTDDGQRAPE